jgi:hypothetical protein
MQRHVMAALGIQNIGSSMCAHVARCFADGAAEPLTLLQPFLDVITDAEASGPITAAALAALRRLLTGPFLTLFSPAATQRALHEAVAALTMCKFEATNPWHDQMVLCKILQVRLGVVVTVVHVGKIDIT